LGGSSNRLPGEDELGKDEPAGASAPMGANEESESPPPIARKRRHRKPLVIEKEWYSKAEAAWYLGVAEITITRYLDRGILHAERLPTPSAKPGSPLSHYGRLRIHRAELDRYLESIDRSATDSAKSASAAVVIGTGATADLGADPRTVSLSDADSTQSSEVMTREEAALRLGVSWRTIKRYIEAGRLRLAGYFRCPDSYTRAHVYRAEVDEMLQSNQRIRTRRAENGQVSR
jgi:hypothetical protein